MNVKFRILGIFSVLAALFYVVLNLLSWGYRVVIPYFMTRFCSKDELIMLQGESSSVNFFGSVMVIILAMFLADICFTGAKAYWRPAVVISLLGLKSLIDTLFITASAVLPMFVPKLNGIAFLGILERAQLALGFDSFVLLLPYAFNLLAQIFVFLGLLAVALSWFTSLGKGKRSILSKIAVISVPVLTILFFLAKLICAVVVLAMCLVSGCDNTFIITLALVSVLAETLISGTLMVFMCVQAFTAACCSSRDAKERELEETYESSLTDEITVGEVE